MLGIVIKNAPQHFFRIKISGKDQCNAGIITTSKQHLCLNDAE